jgi:D-alanine-D-alanine ligase-like ATP-grasp enzyme
MNGTDKKKTVVKFEGSSETKKAEPERIELAVDKDALKKFKLIAVAYSHVEREWFPNEQSYLAEVEVEQRAQDVIGEIEKLGIKAKGYPGDQYFLTNLLVDHPDLVLNLVDTLKGRDALQTSIPAALELANIPYTGAEMQGLVIGNDRHLIKQLLTAYQIPTPAFQYIRYAGTKIQETLKPPLIVKLNESGGSVGIDNHAVKESFKDAEKKVDEMIGVYKVGVIVEQFIGGPEFTVVVFDDKTKKQVFMGEKIFRTKPDGKHFFTSIESYDDSKAYKYRKVPEEIASKITKLAVRAFNGLRHKDYAKFDIRYDEETGTPYFTDCNPNTAFGPDKGLPLIEVVGLYGIKFEDVLTSLLSKYAKTIFQ